VSNDFSLNRALKIVGVGVMACSLSCGDVAAPGTAGDVVLLQITDYTATSVTTFTGCFVRLRFKTLGESTNADVTIDEDNLDISVLGRRSIPAGGTSLMNVAPGFATYTRVEIDLEDDCGTSSSLNITNTHGSFLTASRVTLVFTGTFVFDQAGKFLMLDIDNMITDLAGVTADSGVLAAAQLSTGTF
jgi:hypothetical protein